MREILFRGKKLETSVFDETDWIYGSLIDSGNHEQVAIYPWVNGASTMSVRQLVYARMEGVNPATVGQYTGLKDKNGKRIFEGDILIISGIKELPVYVAFDDSRWNCYSKKYRLYRHVLYNNPVKYEIIGNIHDNPELMKEVK